MATEQTTAIEAAVLGGIPQTQTIRDRWFSLSERERCIFNLITGGSPNKVVAWRLAISERTVEIHRARIMLKMRAKSFAQLVRMAVALEVAP